MPQRDHVHPNAAAQIPAGGIETAVVHGVAALALAIVAMRVVRGVVTGARPGDLATRRRAGSRHQVR